MKSLRFVTIGLAAVCLCSCGGLKEVTFDVFKAAANKVTPSDYTKASAHLVMDVGAVSAAQSGTLDKTYALTKGSMGWEPSTEITTPEDLTFAFVCVTLMSEGSLASMVADMPEGDSPAKFYYTEGVGFKVTMDGDVDDVTIHGILEWNMHGDLVNYLEEEVGGSKMSLQVSYSK